MKGTCVDTRTPRADLWKELGSGNPIIGTGEVHPIIGSRNVYGRRTKFETEFKVGDFIIFGDDQTQYMIVTIHGQTILEISPAYTGRTYPAYLSGADIRRP